MPSLRLGLDRDIYQIVRKYEDETRPGAKITVSLVYDYIQRSNSSLKRQKKRLLEDAIDRVLDLRRREAKDDRDSDDDLERELQARDDAARRDEKAASLINKQLTKHWNFGSRTDAATTTAQKTPGATEAMDIDSATAATMTTPVVVDRQPNGESKPKRRRKDAAAAAKEIDRSPPRGITLADLAGLDPALRCLRRAIWIPLCNGPELAALGYQPNDGVLLHGPSGCGKTTLAHALAAKLGVAFIPVSAPSLVGGTSGESEKNIRDVFDEALRLAPCLVFFDELDSIAGKKDSAQKAMEGRIVTEICHGMDRIGRREGGSSDEGSSSTRGNVVVLAATNRPDSIDPTVRRRFGVEVDIGMPNEPAREKILRTMTRDLALADDVNFSALARLTPGYVGADLKHVVSAAVFEAVEARMDKKSELFLATEAGAADDTTSTPSLPQLPPPPPPTSIPTPSSGERLFDLAFASQSIPLGPALITMSHFTKAVTTVQPAAKREGFSAIPDTTWSHVGALADVRKKLEMTIIGPIRSPARFARVGIKAAAGILLWGPPGCGKTLVAKAVANESKANFISIKGPELLNKYVGESERAVRALFARARSSSPCVLFFDEMDALVPTRDDALSDASARVVNALLTELDGVGDRSGVYVVGATNRPDCIDPAIRRPGRLGTSVFVGLPTAEERVDILRTIYRNTMKKGGRGSGDDETTTAAAGTTTAGGKDADEDMDARLRRIALDGRCEGFSGADLGNLMQAAAQASLERTYYHGGRGGDFSIGGGGPDDNDDGDDGPPGDDDEITLEDWEKALNEVKPSVKDDGRYDPRQFDKTL